jgi:cellulose synthase (UDP-forming)
MKRDKRQIFEALAVFAAIAVTVYAVVRTMLFLYSDYTGVEKITAALLICGELFVLVHGFGYVLNIIQVLTKPVSFRAKAAPLAEEPPVAILVAARHEPKAVLDETFATLTNMKYKNKRVYFLDDSSDEQYKREAEELAKEYGLQLFRRAERHGAKAGIVNDCLKTLTEKYVSIFDADQNPLPDFLNVLIPILEANDRLAFVQSPQFYTNIEQSRIARGAAFQQTVFYEYICEGKGSNDSMFCCGTNVVFRMKALVEVGGLDESTITEDFATSLKLHTNGWKSLYYDHVYAFGMGPESLTGYFKQQFRWAIGTISVLKKIIWQFVTRPFSLTFAQWWEYFLSSSYYLVGFAFFFLMICPSLYLLFKVPSFFMRKEVYIMAFLPYIILSMSVFYFVLKSRNYKPKDLFLGQMLGVVTITVYMRAAVSALLGVKATFGVTEKTKGKAVSYAILWPQLALMSLSFVAVVWGINRYIYERETAIIINAFWAFYSFVTMSSIFYFNKETR